MAMCGGPPDWFSGVLNGDYQMSETEYPLCKRAGLEIHQHSVIAGISRGKYEFEEADFIRAADVEKLLEGAPVVYGDRAGIEWTQHERSTKGMIAVPGSFRETTHTARLVMIEPIKPKSLEGKILEVLDDHSKSATESLTAIRRLLEGK